MASTAGSTYLVSLQGSSNISDFVDTYDTKEGWVGGGIVTSANVHWSVPEEKIQHMPASIIPEGL